MSTPFVSTDWLFDNLRMDHLRIVDASWYLPQAERDPRAEYAEAHIPGAVFFDIRSSEPRDCDIKASVVNRAKSLKSLTP